MFRSRALDFYGSCMIPGMDLASHAPHDRTNAFYDRADGKYHLYLMKGMELNKGQEVCITYGDEKGACESRVPLQNVRKPGSWLTVNINSALLIWLSRRRHALSGDVILKSEHS